MGVEEDATQYNQGARSRPKQTASCQLQQATTPFFTCARDKSVSVSVAISHTEDTNIAQIICFVLITRFCHLVCTALLLHSIMVCI